MTFGRPQLLSRDLVAVIRPRELGLLDSTGDSGPVAITSACDSDAATFFIATRLVVLELRLSNTTWLTVKQQTIHHIERYAHGDVPQQCPARFRGGYVRALDIWDGLRTEALRLERGSTKQLEIAAMAGKQCRQR